MARVSNRARKENARVAEIVRRLDEEYPDAECALVHENPFQLLVATILSAQCTDARVNEVTPHLFREAPDAEALDRLDEERLQELIRSTGFFRNKTKSLKGAARKLVADFHGKVPRTMEELLTLPGVARKTANVVLGTGYGIAVGVVVDTHVSRLSKRLGLTAEESADKIERELMDKIAQPRWIQFSHWLIHHGRRVCQARKPKCDVCVLADLCPYFSELRSN